IGKRDLTARLDAIKGGSGKHAARHALADVRRFLNWCAEGERYIETSPAAGVRDKTIGGTGKDLKRKRVLGDAEPRGGWGAADGMAFPFGDAVRLLMLTGQRLNDVAAAKRNEFDLDGAGGALLTVPPERYKSDMAQLVPLTPKAVEIVRGLPKFAKGAHIF